jgi:elongation factor G
LIERIAETDDELTMKFLEGDAISNEELYVALRKAVCNNEIVPILCGTSLRNKGVPLLLDAIVRYLPSPKDVPPVQGINPDTDVEEVRHSDDKRAFCWLWSSRS